MFCRWNGNHLALDTAGAAAEGELHVIALHETLVVIGLQTQHPFAKGNFTLPVTFLPP